MNQPWRTVCSSAFGTTLSNKNLALFLEMRVQKEVRFASATQLKRILSWPSKKIYQFLQAAWYFKAALDCPNAYNKNGVYSFLAKNITINCKEKYFVPKSLLHAVYAATHKPIPQRKKSNHKKLSLQFFK